MKTDNHTAMPTGDSVSASENDKNQPGAASGAVPNPSEKALPLNTGVPCNPASHFESLFTPAEESLLNGAGASKEVFTSLGVRLSKKYEKAKVEGLDVEALIVNNLDRILAIAPGKSLFHARTVAEELKRLGLYPQGKAANGIGDKLGGKGLNCPKLQRSGMVYHLASARAGVSAEEKAAVQAQLDEARPAVLAALVADLGEPVQIQPTTEAIA